MKAIFVTATDTGAGKTIISGLLGRFLTQKGINAVTQKWIQTGCGKFSADINTHLKLMKRKRHTLKAYLPFMSCYNFKLASSPHLASQLEKKAINPARIKKSFKALSDNFDFVIAEGIGGALVPINKRKLVIDIAKELKLPVLIVVENRLGAINQALLTVAALKQRNMKISGIIFNNIARGPEERIVLEDNPRIVGKITGERILGILPRIKDMDKLYNAFLPIARRIKWISG